MRECLGLAVARLRNLHLEVGADVSRIAAQHDDAIGQQNRFLNVVRHDENGLGGHGLLGPQLQQFAAQVLGGKHVERGERLVHEKDFRLDDQGARKADPLPHAAGEFLGIGCLKAVQAHRIQHLHAAVMALGGRHAAGLQRSFHIFQHRQPGKERKALKHDRDVDVCVGDGLFVPVNLPRGGSRKAGEHAQHGRFAGARRAEERDNFARHNAQVGGRDDLNAIFAGLGVELLDFLGANDRVGGRLLGAVLDCGFLHA